MKKSIHVAGAGIITAIGNSMGETLESFRLQKSGISHLQILDSLHTGKLPCGEIKLSNENLALRAEVKLHHTRTSLLAVIAAKEAISNSGIKSIKKWRCGIISGTTVGGMDRTENFYESFLSDSNKGRLRDVVNHECGKTTELVADELGIGDYVATVNTACSSSVNSIMLAARMIEYDLLDVVVAGGTDSLTRFTLNGFNSLMILDKEPCKPFDAHRNGLNLGEGAGFVLLVSEKVLREESLNSLCNISGFANTSDAFHQTASSPEGRGSFAAMQQALTKSQLDISDIDYINLHGTGTLNNDLSEGTAVRNLFGKNLPRMSSTKSFTGHTLGASGGIEAVFCVMAIQNGIVFPNLRFAAPIPELTIVPQLKFETGLTLKNVMSNSFGFGGNCSSIIFSAN